VDAVSLVNGDLYDWDDEDEAPEPGMVPGAPWLTTILIGPGETPDEIRARWAREAVDEAVEQTLEEGA
jgi:hypothetical protein